MSRGFEQRTGSPRSHEDIIDLTMESEEAFRGFVADDQTGGRAYRAYKGLVRQYNRACKDRGRFAAENETLREEQREQREARFRMEGALTYVEEQLSALQAAPAPAPAVPDPDAAATTGPPPPPSTTPLPSATPSTSEEPPTEHGRNHKVIKIPDPPKFHGKPEMDSISYRDWHLQMRNKMQANDVYMATESLRMSYVLSLVADNALAQLSARLEEDSTRPFTTAKEMLEVLTAAFGNKNRKQEARAKYRFLRQGNCDFSTFWAEFQRLAAELDHSDATPIDDLIDKCHYTIQQQLVTGGEDPTDIHQLARQCQQIEQGCHEPDLTSFITSIT